MVYNKENFRLSGPAAVKSKNVCLHLVDGHSNITGSGIVQLFTQPHPAKFSNHLFWGKVPPKIYIQKTFKNSEFPMFNKTWKI